MSSSAGSSLSYDETRVIAAGLYDLAAADGIHESEIAHIEEFLRESGHDLTIDDIRAGGFDVVELALVLNTTFLRRLFLKAALVLIKADHEISPEEHRALVDLATFLGMRAEVVDELAKSLDEQQAAKAGE